LGFEVGRVFPEGVPLGAGVWAYAIRRLEMLIGKVIARKLSLRTVNEARLPAPEAGTDNPYWDDSLSTATRLGGMSSGLRTSESRARARLTSGLMVARKLMRGGRSVSQDTRAGGRAADDLGEIAALHRVAQDELKRQSRAGKVGPRIRI